MKKCCLLLLSLSFIHLSLVGQKVITVKGEEQIEILPSMSQDQAWEKCIMLARINALENAFGRAIFQGNSTYIENKQTGERIESKTKFLSIGDSYVNGEWLEDKKPPSCEVIKVKNGRDIMKCSVVGRAREIPDDRIEFELLPLDCPEKRCQTEAFVNEEPFYSYFKSPEEGYLAIYLTDTSNAYCLLPYEGMTGSYVKVEQDKEYILFSATNAHDYWENVSIIDEYALTLENLDSPLELNKIFVLFSRTPFDKPGLIDSIEDFTLPRYLPAEDFLRWLSKLRIKNQDVQVEQKVVSIKNAN